MIGNKIVNKITKALQKLVQNTSETIKSKRKIPKERYSSPDKRQKIIGKLSIMMEYQKIVNLLENTPDQLYKFRTKNLVEMNDELGGTYIINSQIKFKTSMLKSSLCDYSDPCILVSGTITITGAGADAAARQVDERNKGVLFKNCTSFTDSTS